MENELQKPYLTDYNLLTVQNLWQALYQILLIILLKKFIELNLNMGIIMTNVKLLKWNTKILSAILKS